MTNKSTIGIASATLWLATLLFQPSTGLAQGTTFTYQGRLNDAANPAGGIYDLRFTIYDSSAGPTVVAGPMTNSSVAITNGLFTVTLDFGAGVFDGADRWLDIGVRTNGGGAFSPLAPRQRITPTPYAIMSGNLAGPLPAAQLTGTLSAATLPTGGNWALNSTLTLDATTLAVDPVNKRVGIGTSSPAAPLTVWPTGTSYGIEHTDGTRRLSTYLDANGCWLGSVSPDKLHFFVNNGLSSMTVDLAGQIGIGTMSPAYPLHLVSGLGGARLDSTANPNGSILELRNTMGAPNYLGAINFNDAAGTFPGQIGYFANHVLAFRVAGGQRMELLGNGQLSVFGTATRGVYAEATAAGGIGMFGFAGPGGTASPGNGNTGVFGESAQNNGNGVVGMANNGTSTYGVWGKSTDGYGGRFSGGTYGIYASSGNGFAGQFDGAVHITGDSTHSKPFLQIHETQDGDFARIQLQVASRPLWHISVGGADNSLVFYNSSNAVVSAISESGVLTTKVLTITGGADIAEPFAMSQPDLPKGAVVVIDEENPGHLTLSRAAYDQRVAGVISGAGGVNAGLSLSQHGVMEGDQQVALTGRVYVQADTVNGPIKPGDLLTTSATPGHAMKVTDHARAQGAVLGKAMTALNEGAGLVLVLVTLQ